MSLLRPSVGWRRSQYQCRRVSSASHLLYHLLCHLADNCTRYELLLCAHSQQCDAKIRFCLQYASTKEHYQRVSTSAVVVEFVASNRVVIMIFIEAAINKYIRHQLLSSCRRILPRGNEMAEEKASKKPKLEDVTVEEGTLFCLGNPLLDISAEVGAEYLKKYDLKDNDSILAEEKHMPIYPDLIKNHEVLYIAGGAGQNAIRVAQWMLNFKRKFAATYIGCIGSDEYGKKLKEAATRDGVKVKYLEDSSQPTGTCAALINQKVRSLVANLGAANYYKHDHLMQPENWELVEKANTFYFAGFFLTVSPPSIMSVAKHAAENDKLFVMNLSAPFIPHAFKDPLMETLPYVDILVGNEAECASVDEAFGYGLNDMEAVAKKLAAFPKENKKRNRIVIFTQGPGDVLVYRNDKITRYPIIPITEEEIVDTNGAGDAFIGGFLSQLVLDRSFDECMAAGFFAAHVIIKRSGCTFPPGPCDYYSSK